MNFAIALYLASAAGQLALAETGEPQMRGAQVADARIAVEIVQAAVLRDGAIVFSDGREGPRPQELRRERRVTYEFE